MKVIYSTDDCGDPICIKISNTTLKRIKEIQKILLDLSVKKDEYAYYTKRVNESFKLSTHTLNGGKPCLKIYSGCVWLCLAGWESVDTIIDDNDLFELPDVYFSGQFIFNSLKKDGITYEKKFSKAYQKMSEEHLKLLYEKIKFKKETEKHVHNT
jgi:hypothetical protein